MKAEKPKDITPEGSPILPCLIFHKADEGILFVEEAETPRSCQVEICSVLSAVAASEMRVVGRVM